MKKLLSQIFSLATIVVFFKCLFNRKMLTSLGKDQRRCDFRTEDVKIRLGDKLEATEKQNGKVWEIIEDKKIESGI